VRAALEGEKLHLPSEAIVIPMFSTLAKETARGAGIPGLQIVEYPGTIDDHSSVEVKENVEKIFDSIVENLSNPSKDGDLYEPDTGTVPENGGFKGTFKEINDFFYEKKWTDGLPIIPPTLDAVEEMLSWTDYPPDEEIAVLPLANLRATPRNIAVNAVMAGCRPEYLPILIAAVTCIGDPAYQLKDLGSTSSIKPFILINGPIVKHLNINYGSGLMSPGRYANSTIGRALGLIVKNIAGFREGETWMGTFGWPGSPWVIAEDEDRTPWNPYHVDRGYDIGSSTVTAMMMMNWTYQFMTAGDKAEPHLRGIAYYMGKAFGVTLLTFTDHASLVIYISPPNAQVLARDGYSKEDVKQYIANHATLTVGEIDQEFQFTWSGPQSVHELVRADLLPKSLDLSSKERIPIVLSPELIHIVVCGSRERNRNLIIRTSYCTPVTREIIMPAGRSVP